MINNIGKDEMVIDKISQKALESLLKITFNSKTEHYPVIAKSGLQYGLVNEIEINVNTAMRNVFSPFSTFITKQNLENKIENYKDSTITSGLDALKAKSFFSFLSGFSKKKEELTTIVDTIDKCMTDELVKSQRLLESREVENPSLLLLIKGIKNLENPEQINGLTKRGIQEVGSLQIGMALNDMKVKTPMIFKYDQMEKLFKNEIRRIRDSEFLTQCCNHAESKSKYIIEVNMSSKQDPQYDSALRANNEIDYTDSFKGLDAVKKDLAISKIKLESRHQYEGRKFS